LLLYFFFFFVSRRTVQTCNSIETSSRWSASLKQNLAMTPKPQDLTNPTRLGNVGDLSVHNHRAPLHTNIRGMQGLDMIITLHLAFNCRRSASRQVTMMQSASINTTSSAGNPSRSGHLADLPRFTRMTNHTHAPEIRSALGSGDIKLGLDPGKHH